MRLFYTVSLLLLIHGTYSVWIPAQWVDDDQLAAWDAFLESQAVKWDSYAGSVPFDEAISPIDSPDRTTVPPDESLVDFSNDSFIKNDELPTYKQNSIPSPPAVSPVYNQRNINTQELKKVPLPCGCLHHNSPCRDPKPKLQTIESTLQVNKEIDKPTSGSGLYNHANSNQEPTPQIQTGELQPDAEIVKPTCDCGKRHHFKSHEEPTSLSGSTDTILQSSAEIVKSICGCGKHHNVKPQEKPKPLPQPTETTLQLTAEIANPTCGCGKHHHPKLLPRCIHTTLKPTAEIAKPTCSCGTQHYAKSPQEPETLSHISETTLQPIDVLAKPYLPVSFEESPVVNLKNCRSEKNEVLISVSEQPPCTTNMKPNPSLQNIEIPSQLKVQPRYIQAPNTHSVYLSQPEVPNLSIQNSERHRSYNHAQITQSQLLHHISAQKTPQHRPQSQPIAVNPSIENNKQCCGGCFKHCVTPLCDVSIFSPCRSSFG